jgi:hypothetical protein
LSEADAALIPQVQNALDKIKPLIARLEQLLQELQSFIDDRLVKTEASSATAMPKVAKWGWLKESKNLGSFQREIKQSHVNLQAAFTALGNIQQ